MSNHPTNFQDNVIEAIANAITAQIPDARAVVNGGGGHYTIEVVSTAFAGKSTLENHRLVYGAIAHLMNGDAPPVHAVDSLKTKVPA